MDYSKLITIEPGKRGGKPCIRGLRIAVADVLEYLDGGMTCEEVLSKFPDLTLEDIRACLAHSGRRIPGLHPGSSLIAPDFDDELPDSFWQGES